MVSLLDLVLSSYKVFSFQVLCVLFACRARLFDVFAAFLVVSAVVLLPLLLRHVVCAKSYSFADWLLSF